MAHHIPLISLATSVIFLLCSIPIHGHKLALDPRDPKGELGSAILSALLESQWLLAAFVTAFFASILLLGLFYISIKAYFMHRNKRPSLLSSAQNRGDAQTGQLFCTLTVLGVFFSMAYFPMSIAFVILPAEIDIYLPERVKTLPLALTGMTSNLGKALTAGAFLALVSHRRFLHFGKEGGLHLWKNALDITIVGLMVGFTLTHTIIFGFPSTSWSVAAIRVMAAMDYLCFAFYVLAIVDTFASARFLWRKLSSMEPKKHDLVSIFRLLWKHLLISSTTMGHTQPISRLYYRSSLFFIPLATFLIIKNALVWNNSRKLNHHAMLFFNILINGFADYFSLAVVLQVYFPGKTIFFRTRKQE